MNPTGHNLDPAIRVLDPNGLEVAFDDNSAADSNNASLIFTATIAGLYTIEVQATAGSGEYLLHVDTDHVLLGDLDNDGFVGLADLDIVLGNWNQSVQAGNLAMGDISTDGFVGLDDLDLVLGNWNASLLPPIHIQGDLDSDGFVGLNDLDIVLENWNTDATADQRSDPSGDGFVGLDDLDLVLDTWNEGTPPATTASAILTTGFAQPENNAASTLSPHKQQQNKQHGQQQKRQITDTPRSQSLSPQIASDYRQQHLATRHYPERLQLLLIDDDDSVTLGLWEEVIL